MRKQIKMSVPGANNWIDAVLIPDTDPHKLLIIVKAGPQQPPHRELRAKLLLIAAEFERRTDARFEWSINIGDIVHYGAGRKAMSIRIELGHETMDEFYSAEGLVQEIAHDLERRTFLV